MKIKLKLTSDELRYLDDKTVIVTGIRPGHLSKDKKSAYTVMLDVADKVMSKAKNLSRQLSLTDSKKSYDITLKWHEAEALELFLGGFTEDEVDPFKINLSRKIISQLNQKLA